MKFYDKLQKYIDIVESKEPNKIPEFDKDAISASFSFYIQNRENNDPILEVAVNDFSDENIDSLAHLIAPMSNPDFFYLVLARLKQDFTGANRHVEYLKFLTKINEIRLVDKNDGPCITPLDLSRR